jgi:hypothetical protein
MCRGLKTPTYEEFDKLWPLERFWLPLVLSASKGEPPDVQAARAYGITPASLRAMIRSQS